MKKVLIIEDNKAIRENAIELLELEGYTVMAAANGMEGIKIAQDFLPHIILCDIMMPGISGHQVFEEVKKNPNTSSIPFVFMTASVEKNEIEKAIEKGADGYITKPFETADLFKIIKQTCGIAMES